MKHTDYERIQRALKRPTGDYSPVSLDSVAMPSLLTPHEFRNQFFSAKTKKELTRLIFQLGHERGLFSDMDDGERAAYRERQNQAVDS